MSDGETNGQLPSGWVATTMGAVADVVGGGTPKTKVTGNFSDESGHPWLTPADLTHHTAKAVAHGRRFLTDKGLATSAAKYMPAGTILFSSRAPIGYVAIASNPITTNQGFRSFVPSEALDSDYAYYYLKSITELAEQLASGTTFNELSGSKAKTLPLKLPPLDEQRRIAARLDEIEARRAAAAERLQITRVLIDRLRGAVLAAAFAQGADMAGLAPLEDVLREPLRNGYSAKPTSRETSVRVLTLTATTSGRFDGRHFKYTDEEIPADSSFWLEPDDILIQRGNTAEFVGVPALYEGDSGEFIYSDLMIRARVSDVVRPRFAWYMLLAPQARTFLRDRATGTAGNMPKINQKILNEVPVPVPSLDEQAVIVRRVDAALAATDQIASQVDAAEITIYRTARSALAKAFRGELVPTTAELAAAEGRVYESADELLARLPPTDSTARHHQVE
jgi:type I restriction enzyme, S subunit